MLHDPTQYSRNVVSVSKCRPRDGLETYFRSVSVSENWGEVSSRTESLTSRSRALKSRLHATSRYFFHVSPLIAEVNRFEFWLKPSRTFKRLSLCCTGLLIYWEVLALPDLLRRATKVLLSTIITRATVLMFRFLFYSRPSSYTDETLELEVNIRHNLLMVGLNITNMHITLTPPVDGTHDFLIQSLDTTTTTPHHQWWRRKGVCRPGQTSVLPSPPIRSAMA